MSGCHTHSRPAAPRVAALGHWMRDHRGVIQTIQWSVVGLYGFLLLVPALLPLPDNQAHILTNLTVLAEFIFWGLWWPFVLISMVLLGRVWCGVFCPEGTLTEAATHIGLGRPIPRWMRWPGWPFVAFLGTTLYGQMASVYQYPTGALVVLGGSTVAAVLVGLIYGKRGTRVWCRHLCPVNGVFSLLSKLSPLAFLTDRSAWERFNREHRGSEVRHHAPHCPPLVPLKQMQSTSPCHMCARCSGYKEAIFLSTRMPGVEVIEESAQRATRWEFILLIYGLLGVAIGAFHWTVSPWFVALKQAVALWLVNHGWLWPLETTAPWWLLTNYPAHNDVFNLLDGAVLISYILTTSVLLGSAISLALALGNACLGRWSWQRLWHLSHALIPVGGIGVFLGLSATTVTLLRSDGLQLYWINEFRALLLALAMFWSLRLAWRIAGEYTTHPGRRSGMLAGVGLALGLVGLAWWLMFVGW